MKENSELKPVKLRLKIDLVSYPVRAEGLANMIKDDTSFHTSARTVKTIHNFDEEDLSYSL